MASVGYGVLRKGVREAGRKPMVKTGSPGHSQPVSRAQQTKERTARPQRHHQTPARAEGGGEGRGLPLTLSSLQCHKAGTVGPSLQMSLLSPERLPVQSAWNVSGLRHRPLAD